MIMVSVAQSLGSRQLSHFSDCVIWIGDFNYRIGLGAERVRQLIKVGGLETLYENDQASSFPVNVSEFTNFV
jgi:hypothetical protein